MFASSNQQHADDAATSGRPGLARGQDVQSLTLAAEVPLERVWLESTLFRKCRGVLGFVLLQTPWYFVRWLASVLQLPAFLFAGRSPIDQDVVELIEGTGLCMLLSKTHDSSGMTGDLFKFEFQHCRLLCAGKQLKSLSIIYRKTTTGDQEARQGAKIICCLRNGEVVTSRQQIYATLVAYFTAGQHPKVHVMGSNLINKLERNSDTHDAEILSPCKYNTTPLHIFLMHTPWSPVDSSWLSRFVAVYDMAVNKQSMAAESINTADMANHKDKLELVLSLNNTYTHFLVHSREALLRTMMVHGIDMKLFEMLWLHCIVHALDHHALSELVLRGKLVFGNGDVWQDSGTYGRICSFMFIRVFTQEVLSPLPWVSNRMADVSRGYSWVTQLSPAATAFWQDLFVSLQGLDADLAAHMTCSIMY